MSDFVDEIRARADITEVVEEYVPLRRTGKEMKALCPFHEEKTPSFYVVPSKGFYKCFGCGESGDAFDFVMKMEGVDFMGACRVLAALVGVVIPDRRDRLGDDERRRKSAQGDFSEAAPDWARIGVRDAVTALRLGARGGAEPRLLLPVWGEGDGSSAPGGWLAYEVDGKRPVPRGLDGLSREGLADALFIPPAAISAARRDLLLFVTDPVLCVRLHEAGYRASLSTVAPARTDEDPWLTPDAAGRIRERSKGAVGRIGLVVPFDHPDRTHRAALQRALHATEVSLLEAGIEPVLIRVPDDTGEPFGWDWIQRSDRDSLATHVQSDRTAFDVFDLRVSKLGEWLRRGAVDAGQAIEKLVPSLRAVRPSSPLLYECYVAWAVNCLPGVERLALESAVRVEGNDSVRF